MLKARPGLGVFGPMSTSLQ
uniref:Uncharacterized protein n=1 Tax=Anguilla anguilla TaxID=7936 RepID=A0A0E9TXA3_ANGAN